MLILNEEITIKNELTEIEYILFIMLKILDLEVGAGDYTATGRKIYQELLLVISAIVGKRFFEDAASMDNNNLLLSIIGHY